MALYLKRQFYSEAGRSAYLMCFDHEWGPPWRQTWRVSPGGTSDASDHRIWDVKKPGGK